MRKNKSMACVLAALMIVQQPLSCEEQRVYFIIQDGATTLDKIFNASLATLGGFLAKLIITYTYRLFSGPSKETLLFEFVKKDDLTDTFATVIGNNDAKSNFQEIISYLHNPAFFLAHGLKAPRGVLLYGEPGNGKTMLARAVAKEAGCNFIAVGASELNDKFIGEGARKVKALFNLARSKKPCIIFIDEIDAIGKNRTGQVHTEVINQLLVEMDGFNKNDKIVIIAATNIPQILDPALLRAGRFDRKIKVTAPHFANRVLLLKSLLGAMNFTLDISDEEFKFAGEITQGFSNADITQICNEIGLYAMRNKKSRITFDDLSSIIQKEIASKKSISKIS